VCQFWRALDKGKTSNISNQPFRIGLTKTKGARSLKTFNKMGEFGRDGRQTGHKGLLKDCQATLPKKKEVGNCGQTAEKE